MKIYFPVDALDQPYFLSGARLVGTQTITLFKKRFIQTYRSWILLLAQLLIPALFTIISITTDRANRTSPNLPRLSIGINQFARTVSLLQQSQEVDNDSLQFRYLSIYCNKYLYICNFNIIKDSPQNMNDSPTSTMDHIGWKSSTPASKIMYYIVQSKTLDFSIAITLLAPRCLATHS